MRIADHDLTAIVLVACVDEPVALAIVRVVRWARLVWGAGVDDAPLGLIHDVGFALLRGHGLRLCGGRERIALDGFVDDRERELLRAIRLRFEDRVLTNLARDPSVQAAHVVIAGTRAAGQDVVIAHALTALLPRLLAKRDWPAQVIGRLRDLTDTNDSIADDLAALLADVDGEDIVAAGAVLDAIDDAVAPALAPEALWELARLDDVPSPAARLALRTVHKTMAALPSPSTSLLTRLQDRRHDVIIDDEHAADVFPAGGFDGMSTRGTFENLVRSEVAYVGVGADDTAGSRAPDLFDVRFVEGELLYYTRDESPLLERRRQLCVVIEEAPRLRHKLAELPTQTLVLCEACVLRAFADLQLAFGASGVTLRWCLTGDDVDVVAEERAVLAASLMSEIAHRRASLVGLEELPTSGRVTFSPGPPPTQKQAKRSRGLWVRVGGVLWTVTTFQGDVHDVDPRAGLREIVDLLMLMA